MPGLKPCPFCGNSEYNEVHHPASNFATWIVTCGECSSRGSERDTIEDAIEAWNRRVGDNKDPKQMLMDNLQRMREERE